MSDHGWQITGPPVRGRTCGSCRACCIQVPVPLHDGMKPANVRCHHLGRVGCTIYAARPLSCRMWSCRWLFDPETADMRRPDSSGYIIDPVPDRILIDHQEQQAIQVWVDPKRPDSHRDPALRAWLHEMAVRHAMPAIIRWGSDVGMMLVAPPMAAGGEWLELASELKSREDMDGLLTAAHGGENGIPGRNDPSNA